MLTFKGSSCGCKLHVYQVQCIVFIYSKQTGLTSEPIAIDKKIIQNLQRLKLCALHMSKVYIQLFIQMDKEQNCKLYKKHSVATVNICY